MCSVVFGAGCCWLGMRGVLVTESDVIVTLFFSLTEFDEEFWFSDWDSEFELPDDDNGEVDVNDDF